MRKARLQFIYLALGLLNFALLITPFFFLRRKILRLAGIDIAPNAIVHRGVKIFSFGRMKIGENTVINNGVYLDNREKIIIGDNVSIAHNSKIYTMGHDINSSDFQAVGSMVTLENNVVIFSNVLIMPGSHLEYGCVIYAGSVVTKRISAYAVAAGCPAKQIKERDKSATSYTLEYSYWMAP
ncbi:putative acetyltransferase [compost metagenome]